MTFHNYGRLENGGISIWKTWELNMGILISLGNWSAKSRKRILQNAIFIVNDKAQKIAKMTFSRSSESGIPTGHWKLEKLSELIGSYGKAIGRSSTGLQSQTTGTYSNSTPRMAYPALRTAKKDDNVDFQLSSASTLHISSSASECTRALLFWCCARRKMSFYAMNRFHE